MKSFLFISSFLLLFSCRSLYPGLEPVTTPVSCLVELAPSYTSTWYVTKVDVVGKHLSGLLLIKQMSQHITRVVFTNEPGVKFFDFEFGDSTFTVHHCIHQLDKKIVIQTLKKDFELILMNRVAHEKIKTFKKGKEYYFGILKNKEVTFFVTNESCSSLLRIESASKRKEKVRVEFFGSQSIPDSVHLQHFNFNMQIALKRLPR